MTLKPPDGTVSDFLSLGETELPVRSLRSFFPSFTDQPSDVLSYIHEGLQWTVDDGGVLFIPGDNEEPWVVSSTIIPPPNSRMMGPLPTRYSERTGGSHGTGAFSLPATGKAIGEAWIRLANGANVPILKSDYDNSAGKRGPARGNGAYWQWFTAWGIVFDHNGANQTGNIVAIHIRDAWGFCLPYCRLVGPRGRGVVVENSNSCDAEKFTAVGLTEALSNGTGDTHSNTTVDGVSGVWTKGDLIAGGSIPSGAYVTVVAGPVLTISAAATATASGVALNRPTFMNNSLLELTDSTVDCDWLGLSIHGAAQSGLLIDSAYGNRISGMVGYTVGGHNVWLRNTLSASPNYENGTHGNRIDVRAEQATKHNVRIDATVHDNDIDVVAYSAGLYGVAVDSDAGWASVYCDGEANVIRGSGYKGTGAGASPSSVVAYGPSAQDNRGYMTGGSDLTTATRIYAYRSSGSAHYSNSSPVIPSFFLHAKTFEAADGSTAVMGNFNGTLHRVLIFADAVTDSGVVYFVPPVGFSKALLRFCFVNLNSGVSGNVRLSAGYADANAGQTLGADEQALGPSTIAVGANTQLVETSFSGTQVTVVASEQTGLAAIRFKRVGADVNDTLGASIGLLGVRVEPLLIAG